LDLGESPQVAEETGSAEQESDDVNTKLDLVTAYMDMGDNEGARELLEEVLKEGGPRQRQRAQELFASLS
jgi:pilus assembly protein FimV